MCVVWEMLLPLWAFARLCLGLQGLFDARQGRPQIHMTFTATQHVVVVYGDPAPRKVFACQAAKPCQLGCSFRGLGSPYLPIGQSKEEQSHALMVVFLRSMHEPALSNITPSDRQCLFTGTKDTLQRMSEHRNCHERLVGMRRATCQVLFHADNSVQSI